MERATREATMSAQEATMTAPGARRPGRRVLPRRSVRARLTALYSVLFLLSGAVLLAITGGVGASVSSVSRANSAARGGTQPQQPEAAHVHAAVSHALLVGSAVALGIMTVASLVLGWIVAGRVLRPLREMTAATQRISEENLHERLAMAGPGDELTDLADTIDGLLERLEGAFAAQRRFVANAAHELRTPLTTMRACVDVAVAKPEPVPAPTVALAGRLRAELDRVDRLLDGFLVLARAQHGDLPGQAALSLEYIVAAALAVRTEVIAARRLIVHQASGPGGTWVRGSQALLCRMVDNVIDNAITHNTDGGWISATTGSDGHRARLVVETGGDILDPQQVGQLAQPFRRLRADRTGSDNGAGLGLSIVAAIASAHGGTLDLRARPGGGLCVAIALPLATEAVPAGVPA
jgi:signal transduction histidine kinase